MKWIIFLIGRIMMFKSKSKFSYSTRGRTIEQNNSGKKMPPKTSKSKTTTKKSYEYSKNTK